MPRKHDEAFNERQTKMLWNVSVKFSSQFFQCYITKGEDLYESVFKFYETHFKFILICTASPTSNLKSTETSILTIAVAFCMQAQLEV
jgi:hypothetical protein